MKEMYKDNAGNWHYGCKGEKLTEVSYSTNSVPIVEAEPVRHGHWVRNDNGTYSCSKCQSWIPNEQHYYARYCLFCGAKMDGGENETNAEY